MQIQMQANNNPQNPTTMIPPPLPLVKCAAAAAADELKASDIKFLKKFPIGYRFRPTEAEIILEYLMKKIYDEEKLPPNMINTVQFYAVGPQDLTERFAASGEGEWHFFTRRERKFSKGKKRKFSKGKKLDRLAGDGFWRATIPKVDIIHNDKKIGERSGLAYFKGKPPNATKTEWLMHEYTAENSRTTQENSMRLDDWVLCKVYKSGRFVSHRKISVVVNENAAQEKIESSRKRKQNKEVKDGEVNDEAIQLSAESSIAISGPSSSSPDIDSAVITYPNNPKRLCSESNPSCGWTSLEQNTVGSSSNGNIYDKAIKEEGIDKPASKAAASSNAFALLMPPYQQVFGFASRYRSDLQMQQGYNQLNVEHQAMPQQHVECPHQFSGPSPSSLSQLARQLLLPYHRQRGPAFKSGSVNGMAAYSDHV